MSNDQLEACVNIWAVVDESTNLIYRISARAYALSGSDDDKSNILKILSKTDYHLSQESNALKKYKTIKVDSSGREQQVVGLFLRDFDFHLPDILDTICKELEAESPTKPIADLENLRSYKIEIPKEPYYVLTFLVEDQRGKLRING